MFPFFGLLALVFFYIVPFPLVAVNPVLLTDLLLSLCHCMTSSTISYFTYPLCPLTVTTQLNKRRINRHCKRDDTTSYPLHCRK